MTPVVDAMLAEARRTSCADWAQQRGWKLRRAGAELVGPCPKCGGDDRFAINVSKNVWLCRGCGVGGDVVFLVQHVDGLLFVPALERLTGRSADDPAPSAEEQRRLQEQRERDDADREREAARYREQARKDAHGVWRVAEHHAVVHDYLRLRGLDLDTADPWFAHNWPVRAIADRPYWHNSRTIHRGPAMIAAIQQPDGRFAGVHQTWLDLGRPKGKVELLPVDGKAVSSKKVLGIKKGCAIRLVTPKDARRMVMGEGIETTLTPYVHAREPQTAYWAGVDLGNMAGKAARRSTGGMVHDQPDMDDTGCFMPPDWVEELVYLCDGDEPEKHTYEKAVRGLRRAKRRREAMRDAGADVASLSISIVPPGEAGTDLNSIAMAEARMTVTDEAPDP